MPVLPQPSPTPQTELTPAQGREFLATGVWGEPAALSLVLADTQRAEAEEQRKQYIAAWQSSRLLYESPVQTRYWPGTQTEAASVSFFTLATSVNGINPQALSGLFYENPPFMIEERPGTSAQAARAQSALLQYQLEDINFREEIRLGAMNCLLFGTAIWQEGWEKFTRERKLLKRKNPDAVIPAAVPGQPPVRITDDEIDEEIVEEVIDRPTFEHIVNHREILVDPTLNVPDIRKAKYVVRRRYMTWDDLEKLRKTDGYNLPSKEDLMMLFFPPQEPVETSVSSEGVRNPLFELRAEPQYEKATIDPFQQPLEVLERWDNKTYIVVLQKKAVIYNDRNIYGRIPFLSVGWWDIPGAFWSLGLGRTIGQEQRLQSGTTNLIIDNATLNLNAPMTRVRGKSIPTQSIRIGPGKIIEIDNQGDIAPIPRTSAVPEAGQILGLSQARVDAVSGNNPITSQGQAGGSGHSNMARSSAGAQGLLAGASTPISEFVDKIATQVFVPLLYDFAEMNRALLPTSQLNYIMSDELKHDYLVSGGPDGGPGDLLDILNAKVKFQVLAGSKMQTRRSMAQGLPLLSQSLANPEVTAQLAIQAKKIDWLEITRMWFQAAEWPNINDVIVDMTPEDLQRQQQQSQLALQQSKGATQAQLQSQKFSQAQQLADQENTARAARDVLREAFKKSVEPDILTGEPNTSGTGFGGQAA